MLRELSVHFLPSLFEPDELRGGVAVVIDVLRASTTIIHGLAFGARAVIPCEEIDDARRLATNLDAADVVLGGERDGLLIDGFDLDNSPLKYTPERVQDKTIVFTTTNGTAALLRSRQADRILIGAFVNLAAIVEELIGDSRPVHLVCAGTRSEITGEDVLCAGAIASAVLSAEGPEYRINDQCRIAKSFYEALPNDASSLLETMRLSVGGANLCDAGFAADIEQAAKINRFRLIPEYFAKTQRIEPASLQEPVKGPTDG